MNCQLNIIIYSVFSQKYKLCAVGLKYSICFTWKITHNDWLIIEILICFGDNLITQEIILALQQGRSYDVTSYEMESNNIINVKT